MVRFYFLLVLILSSLNSSSQVIQTFAGNGSMGFGGEGGMATDAPIERPDAIAADRKGNIYIASDINNIIQRIDTNGRIWRFAGTRISGHSGDGGQATAANIAISQGYIGMVIDSIGNLYFSENRRIRKVDTLGFISTIAGNGFNGVSGDGGPATAAELGYVTSLCFDRRGNLLLMDELSARIRMISSAGIITKIAGGGTRYADNARADTVALICGGSMIVDEIGNIYFDAGVPMEYHRIRKIGTSGIITTFAGGGTIFTYCNGCAAHDLRLLTVAGLVVDSSGNIYASESTGNLIHKITPSGEVYHIAGSGNSGFSGDGGPATAADLRQTRICFDKNGALLLADSDNYRCRRITPPFLGIDGILQKELVFRVYPNPLTSNQIEVELESPVSQDAEVIIMSITGTILYRERITTNHHYSIELELTSGLYIVNVSTHSFRKSSIITRE